MKDGGVSKTTTVMTKMRTQRTFYYLMHPEEWCQQRSHHDHHRLESRLDYKRWWKVCLI